MLEGWTESVTYSWMMSSEIISQQPTSPLGILIFFFFYIRIA